MRALTSRALVVGLVATALTSIDATADTPTKTTYPTPAGVAEPSHVELPGQTDQDYFWWTVPFPATPALQHYEKVFAGWTQCGNPDQWWQLGSDPRGPQNHYLHKFERQWVSPANDRAVSLLFQYWSPGTEPKTLPAGDNQMVSVITTRVKNAVAHFEAYGIKCPARLPGKGK